MNATTDGVLICGLPVLLKPSEARWVASQGNEAEAVGEDFILDDGSVVVDKDVFNGKGGDFGNKDAAEGVCYRSVDANEGEGAVERLMFVKFDFECLQDDRKPWA